MSSAGLSKWKTYSTIRLLCNQFPLTTKSASLALSSSDFSVRINSLMPSAGSRGGKHDICQGPKFNDENSLDFCLFFMTRAHNIMAS